MEREGQQQSGTRKTRENKLHRENLGNDVSLDLVAIPAGSFQMGSTEYGDEQPVHQVTIAPFFLGKYPVTQAQWEAVAAFPKVNLDLNPEPSYFEGNDRPVETVSWWDVMEFCDRLTRKTKHTYRLPSEAEWEYACRAGTTTPFHFGETIATDLANYDGNFTYGSGVKGEYRKQTTPVGSFNVANVFGLYDMHGNVREWCADHWHKNYEGAPIDGSAWLTDNKDAKRLMRGGSWGDNPVVCRSAFRYYYDPGVRDLDLGFRVVCVLA
ncbi:MAG: formylglycine-generating enzyme family protein [Drouetiella hepatica Uher 2000/2452]|uniref:Formylglycine-generating enzyme family protein n=1 Tax=Drouetiella hepatica Uher 2000/2452 TaxID=904376 RepID=A0A951QCF1_9CYAN|nr:formylglycine-generating enzyme family protein [Drouetiella hepatica Uher 2000/2452]